MDEGCLFQSSIATENIPITWGCAERPAYRNRRDYWLDLSIGKLVDQILSDSSL